MFSLQLRYRGGFWPFSLALSYAVIAYACGLILLTIPHMAVNVLGVQLLAHAMVICAYLIHECAHNTVFATISSGRT